VLALACYAITGQQGISSDEMTSLNDDETNDNSSSNNSSSVSRRANSNDAKELTTGPVGSWLNLLASNAQQQSSSSSSSSSVLSFMMTNSVLSRFIQQVN